jgi:hypothetical protein
MSKNAQAPAIKLDSVSHHDPVVDHLMSMVDIGSGEQSLVSERHASPAEAAFEILVNAWKDAQNASFLKKVALSTKYGLLFTSFMDKYKSDIGKDARGEFLRIGSNHNLRPLNSRGHAFFFGAISHITE